MDLTLTAVEKETIVSFNEAEPDAGVYTHNKTLIKKLDELTRTRPAECSRIADTRYGIAAQYSIPKTWVKIRPPRIASEAQKAAARAALEKSRTKSQ